MLKGFICSDSQRIDVVECLDKCRLGRRCLTLPTLYEAAKDRPWNGNPSTTQLLNPFRQSYLKIKYDYWIKPEDRAFAILGVRHHAILEKSARLHDLMAELQLKGDTEITGILDLLEPHESLPGAFVLTDYKTWGAAAVVKFDTKSDVVYQLNHYRVLVNRILAPDYVERLQVQVTVRDGGTKSAYAAGIEKRILILEVPIMADDFVLKYFDERSAKFLSYVNGNMLPPICEDTWAGRRCRGYCDVFENCPEGRKIHNLPALAGAIGRE
jgi:hypothetical protein